MHCKTSIGSCQARSCGFDLTSWKQHLSIDIYSATTYVKQDTSGLTHQDSRLHLIVSASADSSIAARSHGIAAQRAATGSETACCVCQLWLCLAPPSELLAATPMSLWYRDTLCTSKTGADAPHASSQTGTLCKGAAMKVAVAKCCPSSWTQSTQCSMACRCFLYSGSNQAEWMA